MRNAISRPILLALLALAVTNVLLIGAVAFTASFNDRASCKRTLVTRQSLLALRDYAMSATAIRRESAEAEAKTDPRQARLDLKAAAQFQLEANRVTVKQNTCKGLFPSAS